jgi:hypothetical protein
MRLAEIYPGYAEACAALGENGPARQYLDIIRNRAFGSAAAAKTEAFIAKEGSLLNAIIQERGFEFAGEGDRRWTLIRSGLLPAKIKLIKDLTKAMFDGLEANGYYTFENGNTISEYIWTKYVDGKATNGKRLTEQCPTGSEDDPVLFPGWRGVNNDWASYGLKIDEKYAPNLAIKGLFKQLSAEEIASLEADGYKKTNWAVDLVKARVEYDTNLFLDYGYVKAPIYLWPITPNALTNGGFKNGYGFKNE